MTKKRRQSDPHINSSDSTSDENEKNESSKTQSSCPHLKKAVDVQRLRKAFQKTPIEVENCSQCMKLANGTEKTESDYEYDRTLWMCLKCGTHLCGRSVNKHALDHFKTPRSESHAITLNTTT